MKDIHRSVWNMYFMKVLHVPRLSFSVIYLWFSEYFDCLSEFRYLKWNTGWNFDCNVARNLSIRKPLLVENRNMVEILHYSLVRVKNDNLCLIRFSLRAYSKTTENIFDATSRHVFFVFDRLLRNSFFIVFSKDDIILCSSDKIQRLL